MTVKILSLLAATATAVVVATSTAQARDSWPSSFNVGTASQGGTYFAYGSGWTNLVADQLDVAGSAEVSGGPGQNMAGVHTGDLTFGMTTMGPARDALEGKSPLAPGLQMTNACAMFPMYETPFSITVLSSSGITSVADIPAGARIGFGPAGSTSDTYFPLMMETLGVEFERRNGSWSDLAGQMQDGLIDVIAFAAGVPVPAVSQLEVQTDINIIEFTAEEQATILETFPVAAYEIAAESYTTLEAPARSVSMWNFAIAGCDVDEDFVYNVMKVVLDDNERMVNIHRAARTTLAENWDKNTFMTFHPGAVRYYEEKGFDIPEELGG